MRDFDNALVNVQKIYPGLDSEDTQQELEEEQFVALLYTLGLIKDIGRQEERIYEDFLGLVSFKSTKAPMLTLRNTKTLLIALHNIHVEWMSEQDKSEWEGSYHTRIQKYKLLRAKSKTHISDALRFSFLENPISFQLASDLLTEEEKTLQKEERTIAGIGVFKGKSLCLSESDVRSIHKKFQRLYLNKMERDKEQQRLRSHSLNTSLSDSINTFSPKISNYS